MVCFGSISGLFGLAMGILARLRLAKIQTMAQPNLPDMLPKRTKKVRLGINTSSNQRLGSAFCRICSVIIESGFFEEKEMETYG